MSEPMQSNTNHPGPGAGNNPGVPGAGGYPGAPGSNYNYAGNPYAGMPQAPAAEPVRPRTVELAFWLVIASSVLNILNYFLTLNYVTEMSGGAVVTGAAAGGFIFGTAIRIALAALARQGQNWARIVLTVFAALSLTGLLGLFVAGPLAGLTGLLAIATFVAAAVMLFLKPSNEFFTASKAYRQAKKFAA
ncbi:hypothetical protein BN1051_03162 [Arthrobacter saudimassiliensis]|uniref:Uncharacterized protein n=1 Tax=Arthrobacter saudimassiliensis TaxID=1461584 RepID=A0A078MU98_9MICC|nr:hypothetical protein BN1051_03162 [Arthrobacter saudimassiliensis]